MKRLSLIIALALLVTIGGVFAAWHYNRGEVSLEITRSAAMASIQSDSPKGSIIVVQNANGGLGNTIKFLVDDLGETDYKAELSPSGSAYIQFQPAENADAAVKANGIKMRATVTIGGTKQTFSCQHDGNNHQDITIFEAKGNGENSFVINQTATKDPVEITAAQIANCLIFNEGHDIYLNTYDENFAYEQAMNSYIIIITITEVS